MSTKRLNRAEIARALYGDSDLVPRAQAKRRPQPTVDAPVDARPWAASVQTHAPDMALPQVFSEHTGVPIRAWTPHLEANARRQAEGLARLPFMHPHGVALMPDVHVGSGVCVGSVLAMRDALVPSSVGCDIGCGMAAVQLDLRAHQLPDSLKALRLAIEARIPVGLTQHDAVVAEAAWAPLHERYVRLVGQHKAIYKRHAGHQLGTLGGGNHFIEVCLDTRGGVWLMLHSGSRGVGSGIGQYFIQQALQFCDQEGLTLPHRGLGYLPAGTPLFEAYREAVAFAQDYASENRRVMLETALSVMRTVLKRPCHVIGKAVHCHHNYIARETHFGEEVWVTRKGAIRAGQGEWGIIPGSMGTESFIVRGKGHTDAYCSCAHGAGRRMSRAQARQSFTTADLKRQTQHVECRKDREVVDELPMAYKDIHHVMAHQRDLVDVVHTLRQVVCIKG